jgi:pilus assembly protein CpaE
MPENVVNVRLEIKTANIKEDFERIISSIEGCKIQDSDSESSFDLLIMEIGDDFKREFERVYSFQALNPGKEVYLTSYRTEPEILIQALRAGAKEFFPQPLKREDVKNALLKFKEHKRAKPSEVPTKKGKIIDVFGSKGGVGTTTVAVNFADSLLRSQGEQKVALIDMNLLFGEIPLFLNIKPAYNWEEIVRNIARLDSTFLMNILSPHPSGIYVLPSPTRLVESNLATPAIIQKLLRMMQTVFDFVVIDSGQSLDDISLKIFSMSDIVFLVTILSIPCLTNINRLKETFKRLGYPRDEDVKVIINRYQKKSMISLADAEKSIDKKIFWHIPNDYTISMSAINQGKAFSEIGKSAEITKNFSELALTFLQTREEKKEGIPFWKKASFGKAS